MHMSFFWLQIFILQINFFLHMVFWLCVLGLDSHIVLGETCFSLEVMHFFTGC
jgi:hypothetical protein